MRSDIRLWTGGGRGRRDTRQWDERTRWGWWAGPAASAPTWTDPSADSNLPLSLSFRFPLYLWLLTHKSLSAESYTLCTDEINHWLSLAELRCLGSSAPQLCFHVLPYIKLPWFFLYYYSATLSGNFWSLYFSFLPTQFS